MSTYYPDAWVIVKLSLRDGPIFKILASWSGGYGYGASWKLSSGTVAVMEDDESYSFLQESGSTYVCNKELHGSSMTILAAFEEYKKIVESRGLSAEIISSVSEIQ